MADRKASVALELKAGQFKAEATSVEAKLEGVDRKVDKLDRDITKIPADAAKAAAAVRLLGDGMDKAGTKAEGLGEKSKAVDLLADRIAKSREEARRLAEEFNRTGNSDVFDKLVRAQDELKKFEAAQRRVTTALGDAAKKTKDVDDKLQRIPPDAARAAAAMKLLGDDAGRAALRLDELGKSSSSAKQLTARIAETRRELHNLTAEFNRTGNSSVLQKIFGKGDELKDLERLRKELSKAFGEGGQQGGQSMIRKLAQVIASNPELAAAIAAGILIGGPLIGAALNGVLLAGVGLGGIALGIVGQLHSPAVAAALAEVGNQLQATLGSSTAPFAAPLAASIGMLGTALRQLISGIDFGQLSQALIPLVGGLSQMIAALGPGLNEALSASVPMLAELASWLPFIGGALSSMFHEMAGGSKGATEGLRTLMLIVIGAISGIGRLVGALSNAYEWIIRVADGVSDFGRKLSSHIPGINALASAVHGLFEAIRFGNGDVVTFVRLLGYNGAAAKAAADKMSELSSQITTVRITTETLAASMVQKLFAATMNIDQANISWHQSLLNLHDTLAQNGLQIDKHTHQISENTKGGLENRQAVLSVVSANMQQYQAFVAAGGSATDAARQYDDNTASLQRQLLKAHYTQAEIDGLIGKYKAIPDVVNTRLQFDGLQSAIDRLDTLLRRINGLPYSKEVNVTYREHVELVAGGGGGEGRRALGGVRRAALGMVVPPRSPGTLIGEPQTGGEALIPLQGISRPRAAMLGRVAMAGYGMDVVPRGMPRSSGVPIHVTVVLAPGPGMDGAIVRNIRATVKSGGGDVQRVLGQR